MLPAMLCLFAYLAGSIPFSFLIVKAFSGRDVREVGSRNVGATNAARAAGRYAGIAALALDLAKGWVVITLARWLVMRPEWPFDAGMQPWQSRELWIAVAGILAVAGHMAPVWLRFHGGKGVATAAGVFLATDPVVTAAGLLVFVIVLLLFRYVSLASLVTAAAIPLFFHYLDAPFWRTVMSIAIAIAVITRHHSNLSRLVRGTERKLGEQKEP